MKYIDSSPQIARRARYPSPACATTPSAVFHCFVWLDLILPWVILIWLMLRFR